MKIYKNIFNSMPFVRTTIRTQSTSTNDVIVKRLAQIIVSSTPSTQLFPSTLFEEFLSPEIVSSRYKKAIWDELSSTAIPFYQRIMRDVYIEHVINKFDKKEILLLYAAHKRLKNEKLSLANQSVKLEIESWTKELPENKFEEKKLKVTKKIDEGFKEYKEKFISFFDTEEKKELYKRFIEIESIEREEVRNKTIKIYVKEVLQLIKE